MKNKRGRIFRNQKEFSFIYIYIYIVFKISNKQENTPGYIVKVVV